jgi:hypothetical protein
MLAEKKLTLGLGAIFLRAYTYKTAVQYFVSKTTERNAKKMFHKIRPKLEARSKQLEKLRRAKEEAAAKPESKKGKKEQAGAHPEAAKAAAAKNAAAVKDAESAKGSEGVAVVNDEQFNLHLALKDLEENLGPESPYEVVRMFIKKYKLDGKIKMGAGARPSDAKRSANDFKAKVGLGRVEPENSSWVQTYAIKKGKKVPGGKVRMTIEVVPEQLAKQQKLGLGRRTPNHDPFCPKPTGRMTFSLNPFSMLRQLMGDGLLLKGLCLCCCLLLTMIIIMQLPTILTILGTDVIKSWFS